MAPSIHSLVDKYRDQCIQIRRHIHAHPELSHNEYQTSEFVAKILEESGVTVTRGIAKTGLLAVIGSPNAKRKIAFRCDLDALLVHEATGAPFASTREGTMHACGHDVHTAIVAATALVLNQLQDAINGQIKFIFQPAEEALYGGAELVVQEGLLDDVEAVLGIHVDPSLPVGKFGLKDGAMMASVDFFDITIRGQGGHGARPHDTADTLFVASQVMNALYHISGRYFSPLENPTVLSIGRISGGETHNVIPESCTFSGTFRAFDSEDRKKFRTLVETITHSLSAMYGAVAEIKITPNAPPVINDEELGHLIKETARHVFGDDSILMLKYPMMASEDFAYYRQKCPTYFLRLGSSSGEATSYPLHHPKFDADERVMESAVELMSQVLINYFHRG
jgi:amidohydrolase